MGFIGHSRRSDAKWKAIKPFYGIKQVVKDVRSFVIPTASGSDSYDQKFSLGFFLLWEKKKKTKKRLRALRCLTIVKRFGAYLDRKVADSSMLLLSAI